MTNMFSTDAQQWPSSAPAVALASRAGRLLAATPAWTLWLPAEAALPVALAEATGLVWPPPAAETRHFGRPGAVGLGAMPCGEHFLLWREPALESGGSGLRASCLVVAWVGPDGCCANAAWRALLADDAETLARPDLPALLQAAAGPGAVCTAVQVAAGEAGCGWAALLAPAAAVRLMPELTRGVVHDFNNLLHIVANVDDALLGLDILEPDDRALLEDSREAAERAVLLLDQVRVAARAATCALAPLDLAPLLLEALAAAESRGGVAVHAELPDQVWVRGDAVQLRAVLHQLCANALQAMPDGGTLRLSCQVADQTVRLTVADSGPGIPAELHQQVFQPFYTTGRSAGYSGLGLTVARLAAEAHGGSLTVDPAAIAGACLVLTLPVAAPVEPWPAEPAAAPGMSWASRKPRVLVAEDEPLVASFVSRALSLNGLEHTMLGDGAAALELLSTPDHGYDVAFLDICMPGLRGDEVAAALRQAGNLLPVVLTTGYAPEELLAEVRDRGWPVLRKPYQQDELLQALQLALRG